jgi:hypothetical protein
MEKDLQALFALCREIHLLKIMLQIFMVACAMLNSHFFNLAFPRKLHANVQGIGGDRGLILFC